VVELRRERRQPVPVRAQHPQPGAGADLSW
jgi:hypothetical protein